ncbi:MAG: response regulator transcription factor [Planctomycetaceae bacterium]|jgi:DNA-binding NarL/FixJ family response regulator|nr:response regulator transcription factor [Planctomycetaceae bacterium]
MKIHPAVNCGLVRVFVADEMPVIIAGVREFLSGTEFEVVGSAVSEMELIDGIKNLSPHIVLVDLEQNSFVCAKENIALCFPGIRKIQTGWDYQIINFTNQIKSNPKDNLLETLRKFSKHQPQKNILTKRETEIIQLIVQGLGNKQIATKLKINIETVKEHVQNIFRKSNQSSRTQAAIWAIKNKITSV